MHLDVIQLSLLWIIFINQNHSLSVRNISITLTPDGSKETCPKGCVLNIRYCITQDSRRCTLLPEKDIVWRTLDISEPIELFYSYDPKEMRPSLKIDVLLDSQVKSSFNRELNLLTQKETSLLATDGVQDITFLTDIKAACTQGYFGDTCEIPCIQPRDKRYTCHWNGSKVCAKDYWYYVELGDCFPEESYKNKCENGGIPKIAYPIFKCECTNKYTGPSCSQVNVCYENRCQREANCSPEKNGDLPYTCMCPQGYLPPFCEYFHPCKFAGICPKPQECHIKYEKGIPQKDCRCPINTPSNCSDYRLIQSPSEMADTSSSGLESSVKTLKVSPILIAMIAIFGFIVLAVVIVGVAIQKSKSKPKTHFTHIISGDRLVQHRCSMSRSTCDGYQGASEVPYGEDDECPLPCPIRSNCNSLSRRPLINMNNMCPGYFSVPTSMMQISHSREPSIHIPEPVHPPIIQRPPSLPGGGGAGYMSLPLPIDATFSRSSIPGNSGGFPTMLPMGSPGPLCSPERIYSPLVRVMEQEETDGRMVTSSMSHGHEAPGLVVSSNSFCQNAYMPPTLSAELTHANPESNDLLAIDV